MNSSAFTEELEVFLGQFDHLKKMASAWPGANVIIFLKCFYPL